MPQKRSVLGAPAARADSSSQLDPATGERNPQYVAPNPPPRQSTAGGLDSEISHGRDDVHQFELTRASFNGVDLDVDGGITSCGVQLGSSPDGFSITGRVADSYSSSVIGDRDPLVTRPSLTDDNDTNLQAGGIGIA